MSGFRRCQLTYIDNSYILHSEYFLGHIKMTHHSLMGNLIEIKGSNCSNLCKRWNALEVQPQYIFPAFPLLLCGSSTHTMLRLMKLDREGSLD